MNLAKISLSALLMGSNDGMCVFLLLQLDFAARSKSPAKADKAYEESVALLNQVLAQV